MTERPRLPSLEQGLVVGVKEFAASHAISEENQRKSKALTEAVNARDNGKARREYTQATSEEPKTARA